MKASVSRIVEITDGEERVIDSFLGEEIESVIERLEELACPLIERNPAYVVCGCNVGHGGTLHYRLYLDYFQNESTLIRDGVRVELESEDCEEDNEGNALLRFYISRFYKEGENLPVGYTEFFCEQAQESAFLAIQDGSYCTGVVDNLSDNESQNMLNVIMDAVCNNVLEQKSIKRDAEALSWISRSEIKEYTLQ